MGTAQHPDARAPLAPSPHVGRPAERIEDASILLGRGQYGDDAGCKPGTLHAAVLRSPHAHAQLLGVEVEAALAVPGVVAVLTGEEVRQWSRPFIVGVKQAMEHWSLAIDKVRYVGEPVAVVVARSRYQAEDGVDALVARYASLPVAVEIEQAMDAAAPVLHEAVGSNVVSDRHFSYGEPDAAFEQADHRIGLTVRYPRNSCTPIEGAVVVAEYLSSEEGYDVSSNFMGPYSLHTVMALALQVPGTQLRHRNFRDSGGSFGVKQAVFPYVVLMCLASRKAGAPVKWVEDRLEHLTAASSATGRLTHIEAAVRADGRVLGLSYDQMDDCGGYLRAPEPATFYRMHGCLTGPYDIPNLRVRNRIVLTNKMPTGLVRGFGGPQVYFALERLMQTISTELGISLPELYRRNFIASNAFPYRAAAGALLDSGNYQGALDKLLTEGNYQDLLTRQAAARAAGKYYGIGFSAIVEPSISNMGYISVVLPKEVRAKAGPKNGAIASASVSIDPLGGITVVIASSPAGQGHRTVCAQVVADVFGLEPAQVVVNVDFDTQKDAWSVAAGNYSSRFAGAVAGTVHLAAQKLRDRLLPVAAHQLNCAPDDVVFQKGRVGVKSDPERSLPFARFAGGSHWAPGQLPEGVEPVLRETVFWSPESLTAPDDDDRVNTSAAYGFVTDMCGVEIDPDTGRVRIDRYVTMHDAGRILNPALADGQIRGAFAQGLGAALLEEFRYGEDGSFLSGTFADYLLPTTCEVPEPTIIHQETPSPFTPLGAKGLGEGNNMSTPPCLGNAIADALGYRDVVLPATPSKVLSWIGIDDPAPSVAVQQSLGKPAKTGSGKALQASGEVLLAASPQAVFDVMLNPDALAKVIPGCHGLEQIAEHTYRADVTVGIGMIKARYAAEVALSELSPPHSLRLSGAGLSSVGTASGSGMVHLEALPEGGTRLRYDYEAEVSGKVAAVGGRMLEGAARIVLGQLFEQLGVQAGGGRPLPSRSWWQRLLQKLGVKR